ncbi:MAG: hypothetical protein IJU16_00795 [Clostridia bacterium]|nr:hypothetical protein [Clostridia bacterium]
MSTVLLYLVNISITAGWVALAVCLLRLILKKAPKKWIVAMWGLVGLRLLLPVSFESVLSLIPRTEPVTPDLTPFSTSFIQLGDELVPASYVRIQYSEPYVENPAAVTLPSFWDILSYIWLAGVLLMLGYMAFSFLRLRLQLREATPIGGRVWVCDAVKTPFILGVFRPRIYLPSSMDEEDRRYVIAHETAHLKRLDHIWKPLGWLLLAIYWFHPLLWLAYILLCRDIEYACDEKVIAAEGDEHKVAYSRALLQASVKQKRVTACPLAFGETGVKGRIRHILNYKKPAFWILIVSILLCTALTVCFLTDPLEQPPLSETVTAVNNEQVLTMDLPEGWQYSALLAAQSAPVYGGLSLPSATFLPPDTDLTWPFLIGCYEPSHVGSFCDTGVLTSTLTDRYGRTIGTKFVDPGLRVETHGNERQEKWHIHARLVLPQEDGTEVVIVCDCPEEVWTQYEQILTRIARSVRLTHRDAPLYDSLEDLILDYHRQQKRGEFATCAVDVLGTEEDGTQTTYYVRVLYEEYDAPAEKYGEPERVNGSHVPAAITVDNVDGKYRLLDYWTPRDGSYYAPDIAGKFPADLQGTALSSVMKTDLSLRCYRAAKAYFYQQFVAPYDLFLRQEMARRQYPDYEPAEMADEVDYTLYDVSESGDLISFYLAVKEWDHEDGAVSMDIPTIITAEKTGGGYQLVEYWEAAEGEGWIPSIEQRIPAAFWHYYLDPLDESFVNRYQTLFEENAARSDGVRYVYQNERGDTATLTVYDGAAEFSPSALDSTIYVGEWTDASRKRLYTYFYSGDAIYLGLFIFAEQDGDLVFLSDSSSPVPSYRYAETDTAATISIPNGAVFKRQ